LRNSASCWLLL